MRRFVMAWAASSTLVACTVGATGPAEVKVQRPGGVAASTSPGAQPTLRPEGGSLTQPTVPAGLIPEGSAPLGLASTRPAGDAQTSGTGSLGGASGVSEAGWQRFGEGDALMTPPAKGAWRRVPGPSSSKPMALTVVGGWPLVGGGVNHQLSLARQVMGEGWSLGHRQVGDALTEARPDAPDTKEVSALAAESTTTVLAASGPSLRRLTLRKDALSAPEPAFSVSAELIDKPQEAPTVEKLAAVAVAAKPVALTGQPLPDNAASLAEVGSPFPLAPGTVLALDSSTHRLLLLRQDAEGNWSRRILMGVGRVSSTPGAVAPLDNFSNPLGLALRPDGRAIAVADTGRRRIVLMEAAATATGGFTVKLLAGDGQPGQDDGAGVQASFARPTGLAYAPSGLLYVADPGNEALRSVGSNGLVRTVAGVGGKPAHLAWGGQGRLWILDESGSPNLRLLNLGL